MSEDTMTEVSTTPTNATVERMAGADGVSIAVVEAVATAKGVDPVEIEPLYNVVDPDALDAIFRMHADGTPRANGRLTFTMESCEVVVHSTGRVVVTPEYARSTPQLGGD